jgi:hypothetical protein
VGAEFALADRAATVRRVAASLLCAAAVMLGVGVSTPAHSVDLGTFGFGCTASPADLVITAAVGDTFTVDFPGCKITSYSSYFTASSDFPAFTYLWVGPRVITMAGPATYALQVVNPAIPGVTYSVGFAVSAPAPAPAPAAADAVVAPAPPQHLQQVPVPGGGCGAVVDDPFAWDTGLSGGWSMSWAEWNNGPVCSRSLALVGGSWQLR